MYDLTQATVTHTANTAFANVIGFKTFTISATATAAHRPRDVAVVLDFSGSMNNESDLWNNEGYLGSVNNSPNNTDAVFPRFGHYSNTASATLQCTSADPRVGKCNVTQSVLGMPPLVNDYYQENRGGTTPIAAFSPITSYDSTWYYPNTGTGTPSWYPLNASPGDKYLKKNAMPAVPATATTNIAATVADVTGKTGSSITSLPGYSPFQGYTLGPGYWGKTFFIWPPDPNKDVNGNPQDWRTKFFKTSSGSGGVTDDTKLWDSSGNWLDPSGNYMINYAAILNWIKSSPNPFPPQLRAGRILYYSAIPSDVPSSAYTHTNANSQITNPDQRFWKEYIDYVIGVWRDPFGTIQHPGTPSCSYGPDFTWGTIKISSPYTYSGVSGTPSWIHYQDNPERPGTVSGSGR